MNKKGVWNDTWGYIFCFLGSLLILSVAKLPINQLSVLWLHTTLFVAFRVFVYPRLFHELKDKGKEAPKK